MDLAKMPFIDVDFDAHFIVVQDDHPSPPYPPHPPHDESSDESSS